MKRMSITAAFLLGLQFMAMPGFAQVSKESARLPADKLPWTFWYLPDQMGGFGYSYQTGWSFELHGGPENIYVHVKHDGPNGDSDLEELGTELSDLKAYYKKLKPTELDKLSPLEKLALVSDRKLIELENHTLPDHSYFADDWWGNCNGAAAAGVLIPEPTKPVTRKLRDGRVLRFSPADIKAIAAAYFRSTQNDKMYGQPSTKEQASTLTPDVMDEVIRTNIKSGVRFFADISPTHEKWNEPIYGYTREVLSRDGSREEVKLTLDVAMVSTNVFLQNPDLITHPLIAKNDPRYTRQVVVRYFLNLDAQGKVISGEWDPKHPDNRIDYIAIPGRKADVKDDLGYDLLDPKVVEALLNDSAAQ